MPPAVDTVGPTPTDCVVEPVRMSLQISVAAAPRPAFRSERTWPRLAVRNRFDVTCSVYGVRSCARPSFRASQLSDRATSTLRKSLNSRDASLFSLLRTASESLPNGSARPYLRWLIWLQGGSAKPASPMLGAKHVEQGRRSTRRAHARGSVVRWCPSRNPQARLMIAAPRAERGSTRRSAIETFSSSAR